MALKGKTEIELTNVKTGEKEYYVEENMFTDAITKLYQPIGDLKMPSYGINNLNNSYWNSRTYYAQQHPATVKQLLGGIQLWNDVIEENSSTIFKPAGIEMVGCGSYDSVNSTTSTKRGSFNSNESSYYTSGTAKMVYDFQTHQANGTIKSISLSHYVTGINGFGGNDSRNDYYGGRNTSNYGYSAIETPYRLYSNNTARVLFLDPEEDYFYEVYSVSTTKITIRKCKANLHTHSIFSNPFTSHSYTTITIDLSETLSGVNTYIVNWDSKNERCYIVVSPSASSVATNGIYYAIEFSTNTWTNPIVHTLTNSTGSTLYVNKGYMTTYDGYIYHCYSSNNYIYRISVEDGTYKSYYRASGSYYTSSTYPEAIGDLIYYYTGDYYNSKYYAVTSFLDPQAEKVFTTGIASRPIGGVQIKGHPLQRIHYITATYNDSTCYYTQLYNYYFPYIATINNLSREIEKTNEKTMKITYTVTQV